MWLNEAEQANIKDDVNRTHDAKRKRIERKHNKFLKSFADGRKCQDHYKSGGKQIKVDPDLLEYKDEEEDGDMQNYPATETALKKFTTKGLKIIAGILITQVGGNVQESVQHIPTEGK